MNRYVCIRACNLGGVVYAKGDAIPLAAVLPSRERFLVESGFIARVFDAELAVKAADMITIPLKTGDGIQQVSMRAESIIEAIVTVQCNAEDAAKKIGTSNDAEALRLINAIDIRKTVITAVAERIKFLASTGDKGQGDS